MDACNNICILNFYTFLGISGRKLISKTRKAQEKNGQRWIYKNRTRIYVHTLKKNYKDESGDLYTPKI